MHLGGPGSGRLVEEATDAYATDESFLVTTMRRRMMMMMTILTMMMKRMTLMILTTTWNEKKKTTEWKVLGASPLDGWHLPVASNGSRWGAHLRGAAGYAALHSSTFHYRECFSWTRCRYQQHSLDHRQSQTK